MRPFLTFIALIFLASCGQPKISFVSMKEDATILASDEFEGRETGTEGEAKAAAYIEKRFTELQLQPKGTEGYIQKFSFKPSTNPHQSPELTENTTDSLVWGMNVVGYWDNNADVTVVIGAHYDHLGYGGSSSLHAEGRAIHNGADDNASGVAMMLNLAYNLREEAPNSNYLFIAFSGEELGLLGSNYFTKNPTIDLSKVSYMINMDMVGRLNEEKTVSVSGVGTSPVFSQTLHAANEFDLNIVENQSGVGPSDHTSFYLSNIPALHFFTGQHADYHKPGDDAHLLNYEGMETLSGYILSVIKDLDGRNKLAFRTTKNESEEVPRFKVGLGVMPDYLFSGEGMRIDGVTEGRPGHNAGLLKGDVVKKIGETDVTDMMSYMKGLAELEEGQKAKVVVERNGELVEAEVQF